MNRNIDDILYKRFREGDDESFEILFKRYYSQLCTYAIIFVREHDIAEDIVHDTFIRIWERRFSISVRYSFKAYIFKSVHNQCLNYLKKSKYQSVKDDSFRQEIVKQYEININNIDPGAIDELVSAEYIKEFNKALDALPAQCREIFTLCRDEQLSYEDVARRLDISVNTVKTQMKRAIAKLREKLEHFVR